MLLAAAIASGSFVSSTDGVRLWTVEKGSGSPVVVIHGGPGMDHQTLAADLEPLEKKHRVIYYDQRGGGRSTLPDDAALLSIDHHVADLEALRAYFGLKKMTLVAHSFGPAIAAMYAMRHPQRVERMIFLGPIPPRKGKFFEEFGKTLVLRLDEKQRLRAEELQKQLPTAKDVAAVCREYWTIMTPPRVAKDLPATVVKSDMCASPADAIRYGLTKTNPATFGSLGEWNWNEKLTAVKVPALIIHGEEDAIPMSMVSEWITALPDARIIRLPRTAHFPHAERPDVVFPVMEDFLDGRWPKPASAK
jgi:proline iminopeptidase